MCHGRSDGTRCLCHGRDTRGVRLVVGLGYHQPRFSSLDGGWHWGAVGVRGDPEGLPGRGDDDPVVVAGDGGADMESHVARRHVEASAEGVIHF